MKKIISLLKTEAIKYLIFGVLATAVYALVKWLTWQAWRSGWGSETVAQSASIIFAFFTNKFFVFQHKSSHLLKDFISFVSGRLALLILSIAVNWWFIDQHPEILMDAFGINKNQLVADLNLFLQVFIIIINYLYSKFIVFRKTKTPAE